MVVCNSIHVGQYQYQQQNQQEKNHQNQQGVQIQIPSIYKESKHISILVQHSTTQNAEEKSEPHEPQNPCWKSHAKLRYCKGKKYTKTQRKFHTVSYKHRPPKFLTESIVLWYLAVSTPSLFIIIHEDS